MYARTGLATDELDSVLHLRQVVRKNTPMDSCPSFLGRIHARIKRLGWSPCVLFLCSLAVRDDALTFCPTGPPAAALYRPLYVCLTCQQSPTG